MNHRNSNGPSSFFNARIIKFHMLRPQPLLYPAAVIDGQPKYARSYRAGYCALIGAYELRVTMPKSIFAIGERHRETKVGGLRVLTPRHAPEDTLEGQLTFALKYEGANPEVLKALFAHIEPKQIEDIVRGKPTGRYARRIWFLYEWLTGQPLDLPDQRRGSYVSALDPSLQPVGPPRNSPRHRVRNNLPATLDWFPGAGLL